MRKIIYFLAGTMMLLSGCNLLVEELEKSNQVLEERIALNEQEIAALERVVDSINNNIVIIKAIISAWEEEDHVISASPMYDTADSTIIGYEIMFKNAGLMKIYHGKDGKTPVISAKMDVDSIYYWAINGKWLFTSDSTKVKCEAEDGITPKLRITEMMWEVSYDNGKSWEPTEIKAVAEDASICFSNITKDEEGMTFTMVDGTNFTIPFYRGINISFNFEGDTTGISAEKTISIGYMITNAQKGTSIIVTTDGYYKATVYRANNEGGKISITCPDEFRPGFINVIVTDSQGYSIVRVINFKENRIEFPSGLEYSTAAASCTIAIPFKVNFDYKAIVDSECSSWLSIDSPTRSAMRSEEIIVSAKKNKSSASRRGIIRIFDNTNLEQPVEEIVLNQAGQYFSIERSTFSFSAAGETFTTGATAHDGISIDVPDTLSWCNVTIVAAGGLKYKILLSASANSSTRRRTGIIPILNKDGSEKIGALYITQKAEASTDSRDMVFTVRANALNGYTAYLPLAGDVDCIVEWGDGTFDSYRNTGLEVGDTHIVYRHSYASEEAANYKIHISGKVSALRTDDTNVPYNSITAINQWGEVSLKSMANAFTLNSVLEYVAGDTSVAFKGVKSFEGAFAGCNKLTYVDENLFTTATEATDFSATFSSCTALASIPKGLFAANKNVRSFAKCFSGCTSILYIPAELFASAKDATSFNETFLGCSRMAEIPQTLFDNNIRVTDFGGTFRGCGGTLKGETPYTVIGGVKVHLYERASYPDNFATPTSYARCFLGDTSLYDYIEIPEDWK